MRALIALAAALAALAGAGRPALAADTPASDDLRARRATTGAAAGGVERLGPPAPAHPRRVVTLAPSLTDLAVALGKADALVGVTRYDDAPEVRRLPRVGGFLDPSPEVVLGLRPDLVLWMTDGAALPAVSRIAALGVPVLALPIVSVADVVASARIVGSALGDPAAGERLSRSLAAAVEAARQRTARSAPLRVLFVIGHDPLVVAGPDSYPGELLRLAGGENVVRTGSWPVYPLERAVADDPAVVIDGAVLEPPDGLRRLSAIPAVARGAVVRLKDDSALRPGPRLPAALDELARALRDAAVTAPASRPAAVGRADAGSRRPPPPHPGAPR